jgi:hypothetical protein
VWFKRFLLVWVIASVIGVVAFAVGDPLMLWILIAVSCASAIVWLLIRRTPRKR